MASDLALAIAHAEGFGKEGTIPTRAHNPGDLALGDKGHGTLGREKITVFADDSTGWAALEAQLNLIRTGRSHVYVRSMTIREMGEKWTSTDCLIWAANVVDWLMEHGRPNTTLSTALRDVL